MNPKNEPETNGFDDLIPDEYIDPLETLNKVMDENKPEQRHWIFIPRMSILSGTSKTLADPRYRRTLFAGDLVVISKNPEYDQNPSGENKNIPSWICEAIPQKGKVLVFGGHELASELVGTSVTSYTDRKNPRFLEIKHSCPVKGTERWPENMFFGVNYALFFPDQGVFTQWHAKSKSAAVSASAFEKSERKGWFSYSISQKIGAQGKPYFSMAFERILHRHDFNKDLKNLTWFLNAFWSNAGHKLNLDELSTKKYLDSIS